MPRKMLFNRYEAYTKLGSQLSDECAEFARHLMEKYSDCPTRDVVNIATDALDYQAVFARVDRMLTKRVQEEKEKKGGCR